VINILLALAERAKSGKGRHLDVAMTDNVFPFMYWALGEGQATGEWPGNGTSLVTGGTARYRLYRTRDGQVLAAAPIEQRFWVNFVRIIGLEPEFAEEKNPAATVARVAEIIGGEDAATWRARFEGEDCCCSIVQTLQQAMADPHFAARGLFAHKVTNAEGDAIAAIPMPIDAAFRTRPDEPVAIPALGAHNDELLK
jgi:alpha-methylacyl-CoA racemase